MAPLRIFLITSTFALMKDLTISATFKEPYWVGMRAADMRL